MVSKTYIYAATSALFASLASANFVVNNYCTDADATVVFSQNAGCDTGVNGGCVNQGDTPFDLPAGTGTGAWDFVQGGASVSVKIGKAGATGVIQFEYSVTDGIYWDLSDLDGAGAGLVGTPYAAQAVQLVPNGDGAGTGTCLTLTCPPNQVCVDAYQHSDDSNTRYCPTDIGSIGIDLCSPNVQKRGVSVRSPTAAIRKLESRQLIDNRRTLS